ncbi:MAG: enoyl-CoA hydratase [Burkholderiales bacterium]|jgi:2-(1,2-epoxy-1,2-dihydrophenyl)acetyl-CoA isomerase|nr:enoyl-CoA hydratase [Burkholderiales bacterium]
MIDDLPQKAEVRYEVTREHVAMITLNRPAVLNAITPTMWSGLVECLERAMDDRDIRVAVLTGAGQGFCAGIDTNGLGEPFDSPLIEQQYYLTETVHRVVNAIWRFEKPLLAAVNGPAAGFGMDLASWSDIRFASASATFTMSYVRLGFIPGGGGCHVLPRILGVQRALDLIWRGKTMVAADALTCGYVLDVFPADGFLCQVLDYASELASGPPIAHQVAKRLVYDGVEANNRAIALHQAESARILVRASDDAQEGGRAAAERRPPVFRGS